MTTRISPQDTEELRAALQRNNHSVVVMSPAEFIDFSITQKRQSGESDDAIIAWLDRLIQQSSAFPQSAKAQWHLNKGKIKTFGGYLPVFSDSAALGALALEMKRGGNILGKYRVANYSGKSYVILEGYAGLRSQLLGTRYLANNPRVISMAIGKAGAANAIKGGVVITVIFSLAFHSLDQLINDNATWHDFVSGVTVDLVSVAAGSAIAWSAVSAVVGATAMVAIGPIAIVVVTGALLTAGFNALSDHFDLTNKLAKLLREAESRMKESAAEIDREVRRGLTLADEDPVGFMHKLFGVPYFGSFR